MPPSKWLASPGIREQLVLVLCLTSRNSELKYFCDYRMITVIIISVVQGRDTKLLFRLCLLADFSDNSL